MGRIATQAERHWQTYLPVAYRAIGDREKFFLDLEDEAERLIELLATDLEGPTPEGETFLDRAGRLRMARFEAEGTVLRELVLIDPETDAAGEREPGRPDPESPEDRELSEVMRLFALARDELTQQRRTEGETRDYQRPA